MMSLKRSKIFPNGKFINGYTDVCRDLYSRISNNEFYNVENLRGYIQSKMENAGDTDYQRGRKAALRGMFASSCEIKEMNLVKEIIECSIR